MIVFEFKNKSTRKIIVLLLAIYRELVESY